ncbi:MAG: hypothetical protein ACLFPQ_05110 [Candidatus Woesearchaeota archaeon]
MRKSNAGKETTFIWEGNIPLDEVELVSGLSTFSVPCELDKKIKSEWQKIEDKNPDAWDAPKWRFEYADKNPFGLKVYVSPSISYSQHNVMRHVEDQPMQFYPNPMTINTVQKTPDGYILMGVKGKGSDQKGLGLIGAGFVERELRDGESLPPEPLGYLVQRECMQEAIYDKKKDFYMLDARALGIIFGSNHDTTLGVYLPIRAEKDEVSVNGNEHDDILYLPSDEKSINEVLNNGGYKGIDASDHLLGCLEAFNNRHNY